MQYAEQEKQSYYFHAIFASLQEGKRVCVAAPRTDVILELFPRFQKVFPKTIIHALYGGAPDQEGFAELYSPQHINCTVLKKHSMLYLSMKQMHFLIMQMKHCKKP